jgi:glycosyltransferase involved in cell wall biosynthesis
MVKIDHISFSSSGGAGVVAKTLVDYQRKLGHDARLIVVTDTDLRSSPFSDPRLTLAAAIDNYLIARRPARSLISLTRSHLSSNTVNRIREDSIVHFHWTEGVVTLSEIAELASLGRKIVWTFHDMVPFTAVCHQSFECERFTDGCKNCPQVKNLFWPMVAKRSKTKTDLFRGLDGVIFSSPSSWIAEKARRSSITGDSQIVVVPNPIRGEFASWAGSRRSARENVGVNQSAFVFVAVAKNLSDPAKNIDLVVKAFQSAASASPTAELWLIGLGGKEFSNSRNTRVIPSLNASMLAEHLAASNFLVSASEAESFGLSVAEALSVGTPSIVLGNHGSSEILETTGSGMAVSDLSEMTDAMRNAIAGNLNEIAAESRLKKSSEIFSPRHVAQQFIELYGSSY